MPLSSVFTADLDGDGDLDLAVANGQSNNVFILLNPTIPPKGLDNRGRRVPEGLYFVVLKDGEETKVQKVTCMGK